MTKQEKIDLINDKINQINIHVGILQENISGGYSNKEGQPSFEYLIQDFLLQKQALEEELIALTNQGKMI